jgi:hypothetical protein
MTDMETCVGLWTHRMGIAGSLWKGHSLWLHPRPTDPESAFEPEERLVLLLF